MKMLRYLMGVLAITAVAGCDWTIRQAPPSELQGLPPAIPSTDEAFTRLSLRVPRFAGLYTDSDRVLHVKVAAENGESLPSREKVWAALGAVGLLAPGDREPSLLIEVSNTRHDWTEILLYRMQLRDVLAIAGVSFLDADEVAGLVVIGVADEGARTRVEAFAKATDVPADAWSTVLSPMRERMADLQDAFRPLVGGVQIKNDSGPFAFIGFAGVCTLGIVGEHGGATGFITNSHCTRIQGGTEGTNFRQNGRDFLWGDLVAHESVDPPWTASLPGCTPGSLCRFSDASFAVVDIGNQNAAFASVARPAQLCWGRTPCPTAMSNSQDRLAITGTAGPLLVGTLVTKVGRSSGWTGGAVIRACADVLQAGTNLVVLCQTLFNVGTMPGDSGSPVVVPPIAPVTVLPTRGTLAGILWGGSASDSVFSPIDAVVSELGGVRLFPNAGGGGTSTSVPACRRQCGAGRDACMRNAAERGGPRPLECVTELRACQRECD